MIEPISHKNPYYYSPNLKQPYVCSSCILPDKARNYCIFDKNEVDYFVKQGENAFPVLTDILSHSNNEGQITETLHIFNKMIDNGTKNIDKLYPYFSRFNNTTSANIQTYLAGIYRKTQVPDGFGVLVEMLIKNSMKPAQNQSFNPNEEIGGAILSYFKNYSSTNHMGKNI